MFVKLLISFLLFTNLSLTHAEEQTTCCNDGGIVYGDKWAFLVNAPKNWIMSTDEGQLRINAAFFENNPTPKETDAWMYITVNAKSAEINSLNAFIADDETKIRAEAYDVKISDVSLATKIPIPIRQFSFYNGEHHHYEFVAYKEFEDWIFSIVISANSEEDLLAKQSSFIELLDSFQPMHKSE